MLPKLTSMTSILTNLQLHEAASNKGLSSPISSPTLDLQKSSLSSKAITCIVSQDFEALDTQTTYDIISIGSLGLLLGTEAPVMTPNGVDFSFLVEKKRKVYEKEFFLSIGMHQSCQFINDLRLDE